MRTIFIAPMLVLSLILADVASAQSQRFPYEAIVADDEVYARSGPGNKPYYPTSRLRKGDRVTVVRHDPGGWFMIEPPPGSFAWVRQEFVERRGDRGTIKSEVQVVAWVGTVFGDDHYVEQRRLQPGEEVEILGEKTLRDERGEFAYFRIKSPKGHFRWVPGARVIPADKSSGLAAARGAETDPFHDSATNIRRLDSSVEPVDMASLEPRETTAPADNSSSKSTNSGIGRRPAPTPEDLEADVPTPRRTTGTTAGTDSASPFASSSGNELDRLEAIDEQMRQMLRRDTRDWDFTAVEAELRELARHEATAEGASRRLLGLGKYQRIKADYDEFVRIMDTTSRRDAELAAAQRANQTIATPTAAPATRSPITIPNNSSRTTPAGSSGPIQRSTTAAPPAVGAPRSTSSNLAEANKSPSIPRFQGAGIIQRSGTNRPGFPKHVLMHPNGRPLAYLQGDGVDLDKYLGESMGLTGERSFRRDLNLDFMIVRGLQPVRLKP
jgi:hypothetical protein